MPLMRHFSRNNWKYWTVSKEADAEDEWDSPTLSVHAKLIALQLTAAVIFPFSQRQNIC